MVAFPDDVGTESNESYVPFVAACERFSQGIKHWSKTTHADWLRSMTKQDVIKLINASKANDKIGVGNKGYNEAVASHSISRMPFMEQYVNEYDAIGTTIGVNAGAPSNPNSPRGPNVPWSMILSIIYAPHPTSSRSENIQLTLLHPYYEPTMSPILDLSVRLLELRRIHLRSVVNIPPPGFTIFCCG